MFEAKKSCMKSIGDGLPESTPSLLSAASTSGSATGAYGSATGGPPKILLGGSSAGASMTESFTSSGPSSSSRSSLGWFDSESSSSPLFSIVFLWACRKLSNYCFLAMSSGSSFGMVVCSSRFFTGVGDLIYDFGDWIFDSAGDWIEDFLRVTYLF